jgi:hypothetical protein
MPPFLLCRGSSNRNRYFAEMRAALHMGKRLFRLVERKGLSITGFIGEPDGARSITGFLQEA